MYLQQPVAERDVFIIGVGCTTFTNGCVNGPTLLASAAVILDSVSEHRRVDGLRGCDEALPDASNALPFGITYDPVEAAFVGYIYGASTTGQAALHQLGLTGIRSRTHAARPARVDAWTTDAVHLRSRRSGAFQEVWERGGASDDGTELHSSTATNLRIRPSSSSRRGSQPTIYDRAPRMPAPHRRGARIARLNAWVADAGDASVDHLRTYDYGGGVEHLAKIGRKHSVNNPYTQFQARYDEAAVLDSLHILNSSLIANKALVHANKLENQAIEPVATGTRSSLGQARAGIISNEARAPGLHNLPDACGKYGGIMDTAEQHKRRTFVLRGCPQPPSRPCSSSKGKRRQGLALRLSGLGLRQRGLERRDLTSKLECESASAKTNARKGGRSPEAGSHWQPACGSWAEPESDNGRDDPRIPSGKTSRASEAKAPINYH
ncbi:hypothetical protein EDB86DRAFT_2835700 [Lactarius hatsudake]|nr:hypothetical protein EDB86DRAFT_2835700 [Lactarius hatsudake]